MNKVDRKILEDPNVRHFGDKYYASRFGDIYSVRGPSVYKLKPYKHKKTLTVKMFNRSYGVARVVWETFKGSVPDGYTIGHKDGATTNCELHNLVLITYSDRSKQMRKAQMRRFPSVKDLDTGITYPSSKVCAKALNYSSNYINHICSGRYLPNKIKVVYVPKETDDREYTQYKVYAYIKDDLLITTGTAQELCQKLEMTEERFRYLVRKDKNHPDEKMIPIRRA